MMTEAEKGGLIANLERYLNAVDKRELDTPVGWLVNERIARFLNERRELANEDEILEMTRLMEDHKRLLHGCRPPHSDTSEPTEDDFPPP
jgi:hypothetical protein